MYYIHYTDICTDVARVYEKANRNLQQFIQNLSLFFSGFFKAHLRLLESTELQMLNLEGQKYLVQIACVDDVEVFKICLEYFNFLVLFNYLFLALLCVS